MGRAVAHLAADPEVLALSGEGFQVALAGRYRFVDVDGGASSGFSCPGRTTCRSSPIQSKQLGRWRRADQIVVPKARLGAQGSRRAAIDRRRDRHDRRRSVVDRRRARALTPALNCGFPMILPDL
jgi:hypothetical protein